MECNLCQILSFWLSLLKHSWEKAQTHFLPEHTGWKQRWHLRITSIVSFPVFFLSVSTYCLLLLMVCFLEIVDLISSGANWKIGHILHKTWYLNIVASMWSIYMIWKQSSFCSPCRSERETMAGVLFESFTMVGSQIREGNWTSNLSEFTCQWSHSSCCWCQSCCPLLVPTWSKLGRNFFEVLCTGRMIVVGWRR